MSSLGYICEHHSYTETGRLDICIRTGFICGKYDQREVKINFIVYLNNIDKPNCYVQLVSMYRYSGYVKETLQVSWYENQSTWLGIVLRL